MKFTQEYLEYYQYVQVFADNDVSLLVSSGLHDKFTDEEKLRNDFVQKLAKYNIEVKGNLL